MSQIEKRVGIATHATLLATLLLVGAGCESRQQGADESSFGGVEPHVPAVASAPSASAPNRAPPDLAYAVIAPEISEETPVVQRRLQPGAGRTTFLRNDTLYAAVDDLVPILSPRARVSLSEQVVVVNGRRVPVTGIERNGVVYVPVKAFARQFGAYTLVNEVDGSATIWRREVLIYWKKHGPGNAPVLQNAAAEGLLPP